MQRYVKFPKLATTLRNFWSNFLFVNMKGSDLKQFRVVNNLTQTELGDYLGIQKGFVSKIENGKEKPPQAKFQKLLENPHNWDISMLTAHEEPVEVDVAGLIIKERLFNLLDKANATNEMLLKMIEIKDRQIQELSDRMVETLSTINDLKEEIQRLKSKGETAENAGPSSCANVG